MTTEKTLQADDIPELTEIKPEELERLKESGRAHKTEAKLLPFLVVVRKTPMSSTVRIGDSATFNTLDESHARRMFIQSYGIDPEGIGLTADYGFDVFPQFEDLRPGSKFSKGHPEEVLRKYQEGRGKILQPEMTTNSTRRRSQAVL